MSALISLLLAVGPVDEAFDSPEPRVAVFVQPIGSVAGAFLSTVWISGGVQRQLVDRWSLVIDASLLLVTTGRGRVFADISGSTSVSVSAGLGRQVTGTGLSGFFVTPKVWGVMTSNLYDSGPSPLLGLPARGESWLGGEVGVGVDLAFQVRMGAFFIGAVFGLGLGLAMEGGRTGADPFSLFGGNALRNRTRSSGAVVAFNANLLRLGFAF